MSRTHVYDSVRLTDSEGRQTFGEQVDLRVGEEDGELFELMMRAIGSPTCDEVRIEGVITIALFMVHLLFIIIKTLRLEKHIDCKRGN